MTGCMQQWPEKYISLLLRPQPKGALDSFLEKQSSESSSAANHKAGSTKKEHQDSALEVFETFILGGSTFTATCLPRNPWVEHGGFRWTALKSHHCLKWPELHAPAGFQPWLFLLLLPSPLNTDTAGKTEGSPRRTFGLNGAGQKRKGNKKTVCRKDSDPYECTSSFFPGYNK